MTTKLKLAIDAARNDDMERVIKLLEEALAEQAEQEPIRFVWNGEGWIEADEYVWKTTPDAERRELYATPQPDMNLNCKSVQKRLATVWGYVKAEQAEQEPVAWMNTNGAVNKLREAGWAMNAAPVRTKDLSDYEIAAAIGCSAGDIAKIADARAVIAAYKEKNK